MLKVLLKRRRESHRGAVNSNNSDPAANSGPSRVPPSLPAVHLPPGSTRASLESTPRPPAATLREDDAILPHNIRSSSAGTSSGSTTLRSISKLFRFSDKTTLYQDCVLTTPALQFSADSGIINAGGDIGSRNVLQQGHGNVLLQGNSQTIHLHAASFDGEHKLLLQRIVGGPLPMNGFAVLSTKQKEKIDGYIVPEAELSKEVHGEASVCYENTRIELLDEILLWIEADPPQDEDPSPADVSEHTLCIGGAPGSGKSTIMNTMIIILLEELQIRCPGLLTAHYIAGSILDLLDRIPHTRILSRDVRQRIFLCAIGAYSGKVLVIIDALDEASDPATLAATLSRIIRQPPPNIRLLLATRNEHDVLTSLGDDLVPNIVRSIPTKDSFDEVGRFIEHRLRAGVKELFGGNPLWSEWPSPAQIRHLEERADGLFIWARTAVDYILSQIKRRGSASRDRLLEDLGETGMKDVATLYTFILKTLAEDHDESGDRDETLLRRMKEVLGFIIVAKVPPHLDEIKGFLGFNAEDFDIIHFVELVRSILVPGTEIVSGHIIPRMHKSFVDFIISGRAPTVFRIDLIEHHRLTLHRCFDLMASDLHFNSYGLRSSFLSMSNTSPQDLRALKPKSKLPKGLSYAVFSWRYHLEEAGLVDLSPSNMNSIRTFLYEKLLFWLEVASVTGRGGWDAVFDLNTLAGWLHRCTAQAPDHDAADMAVFAEDASALVNIFTPCTKSEATHVYVSLLAFSPANSIVARHFRNQISSAIIPHPADERTEESLWAIDCMGPTGTEVYCISFSPCGRRLIAGHNVGVVRCWNIDDGSCIRYPSTGFDRAESVTCACFSKDGLFIACGSSNGVIRAWDAETGECFSGPSKNHTNQVFAVSFSDDGARIVSASLDGTIRIWNIATGASVGHPLDSCSDSVLFGSYFPDGLYLISGSNKNPISPSRPPRGSNAHEHYLIFEDYHTILESLDFSSDIQSDLEQQSPDSHANHDTIWIWNFLAGAGTVYNTPFGDATSVLCGFCFSHDKQYLAFGFGNNTIRIWDTRANQWTTDPIGGSTGPVNAVSFSPDGRYLAAGSKGAVVRLWDTQALMSRSVSQESRSSRSDGGKLSFLEITRHEGAYASPHLKAPTAQKITDNTVVDSNGWTLGPQGEMLFWAPSPVAEAIWRPSTIMVLGRPSLVKPDLSRLVTGEEWLQCFPKSA